MHALLRSLALHQAQVRLQWLDRWQNLVPGSLVGPVVDGLVLDGLWLTKFPLLFRPSFDPARLSALDQARHLVEDPGVLGAETAALVRLVDADVVRFVVGLAPENLETRFAVFSGGRALNKPLWMYLSAWFDRATVLRARVSDPPDLLETVFR